MFKTGDGVPQDAVEAAQWYRRSAKQGDTDAQYYLAIMLRNGEGVEQNHREATKWNMRAAEQGYELAKFNLNL